MEASKKKLIVGLLLDRSGSMSANWDKTISACNEYITGLQAESGLDAHLTVTVFDSTSIDVIRSAPVADIKALTPDEAPPRGCTPLNDAVGRMVADLSKQTPTSDTGVVLVVMTDGQENASVEYKKDDLKATLADKQHKENWMVIFLGANLEAFSEASALGVMAGNAVMYDAAAPESAMASTRAATMSYASTGNNDANADLHRLRDEPSRAEAPSKVTPAVAGQAEQQKKVTETTVKKW